MLKGYWQYFHSRFIQKTGIWLKTYFFRVLFDIGIWMMYPELLAWNFTSSRVRLDV